MRCSERGEASEGVNGTTTLGRWAGTKMAPEDKDHPEDHLKDGEIVGNLPLGKRRRGSVRTNTSTDLREEHKNCLNIQFRTSSAFFEHSGKSYEMKVNESCPNTKERTGTLKRNILYLR